MLEKLDPTDDCIFIKLGNEALEFDLPFLKLTAQAPEN